LLNLLSHINQPDITLKGRVYVAGTGVISAIGTSSVENYFALQHHLSGIGKVEYLNTRHNDLPIGEVKLSNDALAHKAGSSIITRTALLGLIAAREAIQNSKIQNLKLFRTGLISATTVGGMDRTEEFMEQFVRDHNDGDLRDVVNHECGTTTEIIAEKLHITDFISTINTACSSSVNSIMLGARMISAGLLDVVIAGGTDSLTRFTLNGFNSLMILDKELCRPFDATRNGLNLGEGAGYVVLVSEEVVKSQRLNPTTFVSGFANTNDAFHQTASSPEGRGSFAAMKNSLTLSGLKIDQIDYINLHGTGTVNNDQSEGTAIKRLFGEGVPPLSSTKSFTGHTLGACGGIEAVYAVLAIENRCLFPSLRFSTPMPDVNIRPVTNFQSDVDIKHVMSNSFGFGGNCSSIIFSKVS
jgi:3-oxoacyl-(acyl-carrier-protein) synthase